MCLEVIEAEAGPEFLAAELSLLSGLGREGVRF